MVNWQILSQLQGPQIDVNLFPQAGLAGAQASRYNPGTLAAIGQGVTQGIGNFLDVYQGFQQIDLNSAKIDAAEAQAKIMQHGAEPEQLETADLYNQSRASLEANQATQARNVNEFYDANKERLQRARDMELQAKTEQDTAIRNNAAAVNEYNELMTGENVPSQALVDAAFGTRFNEFFRTHPGSRGDLLNNIWNRADVDPDMKQRVNAELQIESLKSSAANDFKKNAPEWRRQIDTAESTNTGFQALNLSRHGLLKNDVANLKPYNAGQWEHTPDGYYTVDELGHKRQLRTYVPSTSDQQTEWVYTDPRTGREKLIATLNSDETKEVKKLQEAQIGLSGSVYEQRIRELRSGRGTTSQQTGVVTQRVEEQKELPLTFEQTVQNQLKISPQVAGYIKMPLNELEGYVKDYLYRPEFRTQDVYSRMPTEHMDAMVKLIAEDRFKNPFVRGKYTQAYVDKYNASLESWTVPARGSAQDTFLNWVSPGWRPKPVKTAFELYLREQRPIIVKELGDVIDKWHVNQVKKAQATYNRSNLGAEYMNTVGQ